VSKALAGLRYGSVEITVHDGKVTQIEAKKKIRLNCLTELKTDLPIYPGG
jgi:hypothetical protein